MFRTPFISKNWMASDETPNNSEWIMIGVPFDGTCSFRPGTRFAPEQIRVASRGIETYSPYFNKDLEDISFYDAGEIDLPFGNTQRVLDMVYDAAREVLAAGKKYFGIGGEHLVSYPAIKAYYEKYPDLYVVHFDAHTDLRDEYLGEPLSHSTVIKKVADLIGFDNLSQIGIRSGEAYEFELMKKHNTLVKSAEDFRDILSGIKGRPVFITLDLDVLDPSLLPGTGTPEVGGFSFCELMSYFKVLADSNIVGMDMLELSPFLDTSANSTVAAAKVAREMLCVASR